MKLSGLFVIACLVTLGCEDRQRQGAPETTNDRPATPANIIPPSENTSQPNQGDVRDQGDRGSPGTQNTGDRGTTNTGDTPSP